MWCLLLRPLLQVLLLLVLPPLIHLLLQQQPCLPPAAHPVLQQLPQKPHQLFPHRPAPAHLCPFGLAQAQPYHPALNHLAPAVWAPHLRHPHPVQREKQEWAAEPALGSWGEA